MTQFQICLTFINLDLTNGNLASNVWTRSDFYTCFYAIVPKHHDLGSQADFLEHQTKHHVKEIIWLIHFIDSSRWR